MTTGPATPAPTMPADMVMEVLGTAAGDVLLIGGQALAVWARHFGVVRTDRYDITRDVDFLVVKRHPVSRIMATPRFTHPGSG